MLRVSPYTLASPSATTLHAKVTRRLSRRAYLSLIAGVGAFAGGMAVSSGCERLPFASQAARQMPRIGYLALGSSPSSLALDTFQQAFLDGLRELGYVEGQNVTIEWRSEGGR